MFPRDHFSKACLFFVFTTTIGATPEVALAEAEVKFDRDFLAGVVEKLPPAPFSKEGQYRGSAGRFRLAGIDPKGRRLLISCVVAGEFRAPLAVALKTEPRPDDDWKGFTFDVKVAVRAEAGPDGAPRFAVEVVEVKRRALEGVAGGLARVLGKFFDELVTQVAAGKVAGMNAKLNGEILKRAGAITEYGVLQRIDYAEDALTLRFDVTRLKSEGILGHVHDAPGPGLIPLHRWYHPRRGDHDYSTTLEETDLLSRGYVYEGVACHVPEGPGPGIVTVYRWRSRRERLYTTDVTGEGLTRRGYRPESPAFHVFNPDAPPPPGTSPFYRFVDPRHGLHFYTTHPHAEFAK
ncbi:MAG: hypothetical protein AB7I30_24360 [Isosphaeraceae bacterium]